MNKEVMEAEFDLVVIGGGLAGVCAAIAAARHGCLVALVQDRPVLGGNSSNEIRVSITGASAGGRNPFARESGIIEELLLEDRRRASTAYPVNGEPRPEWDWLLAEWVTREPNIALFLNTRAIEAIKDAETGNISAISAYQMSTEKEYLFRADYFVDASGDGSIAASAGAEFRYGREGSRQTREFLAPISGDKAVLGSSLLFCARDAGHPVKFTPPAWAYDYPQESDIPYRDHDKVNAGYWWIEYGGNQDTIADAEKTRDELLKMLYGVWDHIKNHGDHRADNLVLDWVGSVLAKRESRRVVGDHVLTYTEIDQRPEFHDAVAYGGWPVDIHPAEGLKAREQANLNIHTPGPYNIPLRSLYAKDVPNLFLAGRNISATHLAFASARVMGTCAVEGQAVGTAAALCLQYQCTPRELAMRHASELQQILLKDDCYIVGVRNLDTDDLLLKATASADSQYGPLEITHSDRMVDLDDAHAQMFTVSEPYLERVSVWLQSNAKDEIAVKATLYKAQHLTDFASTQPIAAAVANLPPGKSVWVGFPFQAPVEPGACYWIAIDKNTKLSWGMVEKSVPGLMRAENMEYRKLWLPRAGCHTFRLTPQTWPYGPQNLLNGVSRPERGSGLWLSNPHDRLPQSVAFDWPEPVQLDTLYVTFDTNLDSLVPFGPSPDCVRDYRFSYLDGETWKDIIEVSGNYQRRRCHEFPAVTTKSLRLTVVATNGAPMARVYEVRAYLERPEELKKAEAEAEKASEAVEAANNETVETSAEHASEAEKTGEQPAAE